MMPNIAELEQALENARDSDQVNVVVIDTDPYPSTEQGGAWWEVAVPAVSERTEVQEKRKDYEQALIKRDNP